MEYYIKRSKCLNRIRFLRSLGAPEIMLRNERWNMHLARVGYYTPAKLRDKIHEVNTEILRELELI